VVLDSINLGPIFIQSHLQKIFSFSNWHWVARSIGNNSYLLEPPNDEWRRQALAKGRLILSDIVFPVEPFDPLKHDRKGKDLEFHRIADELGRVLLDVDPRSVVHIDFTVLRIRVDVPALKSIPSRRNMFFSDSQGRIKLYQLSFDTDISTNSTQPIDPWSTQTSVIS
jgi:hypothetical protein